MKKPILGVDFGGTFISNKAADLAHYQWFKVMAVLLQDPSIEKLAGKENYFPEVIKIMSMYTGLKPDKQEDKEILVRWGRSLFSFMSIGAANKLGQEILFKDFAEYLKELKSRFELALVTTQPQDSAKPILSALGCEGLFDYIYESSFYEQPDKFAVLKRFVNENGKPLFCIGNSKEDIESCEKLGIKIITVGWDKQDLPVGYRKKLDADDKNLLHAETIEDLKRILEGNSIKAAVK